MATISHISAATCNTARTVTLATRDLAQIIGEMSLREETSKRIKRGSVDIEDARVSKKQRLFSVEFKTQARLDAFTLRPRATRRASRHRSHHILSAFPDSNHLSIAPMNYEFRFDFRITPVRASDAIREVQRQQYPEYRRPKSSPILRPSVTSPIDPNDYVELVRQSFSSAMYGPLLYCISVDPRSPMEHFDVSIDGFDVYGPALAVPKIVGSYEALPCYKPPSNRIPSDAVFNAYPRAAIGLPPIARPTYIIGDA